MNKIVAGIQGQSKIRTKGQHHSQWPEENSFRYCLNRNEAVYDEVVARNKIKSKSTQIKCWQSKTYYEDDNVSLYRKFGWSLAQNEF